MFDLYFSVFIDYQNSQKQTGDPLAAASIFDITLAYLYLTLLPLLFHLLIFSLFKKNFIGFSFIIMNTFLNKLDIK